jgi:hypothetical protein
MYAIPFAAVVLFVLIMATVKILRQFDHHLPNADRHYETVPRNLG